MPGNEREQIFIYGPPAVGKTRVGDIVAERLELPFFDLDEWIEAQAGKSIPEIFAEEGEAGFRRRESAALESVLNSTSAVVALGGGALLNPENRRRAEAGGWVLCLQASFETILKRLDAASGGRPLLDGDTRDRLAGLLGERAEHYASFPLQVSTEGLEAEDVAWEALTTIGRFYVTGMGAGYDVQAAHGSLDRLGSALARRSLRGPVALVSDENVAELHMERVEESLRSAGYEVHPVVIPAGEANKTIQSIHRLWEGFLDGRLERQSTVVALGGGVLGDLAGFAAATFLRGVHWVAVPTTLLAMVDAALGGKTGADLPQGKNLIGAFHPPELVSVDPQTLTTLPEAELRNGLAEVVKHGVIGDQRLFDLCRLGWDAACNNLDEIVRRSMAVKVRVIREDPYERGRRAALNLGHTLGHALESASDFRIRHGEAVAIGMVQAARLSERRGLAAPGLTDEIQLVLEGLGLPWRIPDGLNVARLRAAIGVDKKRSGGKVRLALPVKIGEVQTGIELDDAAELLR